ncbi:hypothetical protein EP7_004373 [Isosphaeraceae bacterium EP7]
MVKKLAPFALALFMFGCGNPADETDDVEATPSPTVEPTQAPTPVASPTATPVATPKPKPTIAPALVPDATCTRMRTGKPGGGQFVNNPNNDKGVLKIIWPNEYTNKIVDVTVWGGIHFYEPLIRKTPNEYNDRERYYGKLQVREYPKPLVVGARLYDGNRVCVTIPDPAQRLDLRLD